MSVDKSFTAVAAGPQLLVRQNGRFTYDLSGTFSATLVLERSTDGGLSWTPVVTATAAASGTVQAEPKNGSNTIYRFRCNAFTSGTAVTSLTAIPSTVKAFFDESGAPILVLKEDGPHMAAQFVDDPLVP